MSRKQWKAGVIVALSLVFVAWSFWPAQAGSSTKGNSADKMSQNIDFVTYVDDADWTAESSDHVLIGGVFTSDQLTSGDTGPVRLDADRHLQVDIVAGTVTDTNSAAIKTAVEGTEDELDGTTTDGPLAVIAHTNQTLAFARIDDDSMTGGAYTGALVAASSGNKIYVVELFLMVDAQSEIEWVEDPQGTPAILANAPPMFFPAYGGVHLKRDPGYRFVTTTVNKALGLDEVANGTVGVRGYIWYYYAP